MIKGLEVLQEIKSKTFSWEKLKDCLDTIEKELKALEIIKEKRVNINNFLYHITKDTDYKEYKRLSDIFRITIFSNQVLTQEEYDLLKEALL